ncbi:hypothetical protein B0T09DRAFT_348007 [Sordaria sp. MPI-SDFR-AT-0083]|nr:hypothetical protein B0T09DRAFT_348007 [Sordaria sp. MPI-SDFR-AT-0083]
MTSISFSFSFPLLIRFLAGNRSSKHEEKMNLSAGIWGPDVAYLWLPCRILGAHRQTLTAEALMARSSFIVKK